MYVVLPTQSENNFLHLERMEIISMVVNLFSWYHKFLAFRRGVLSLSRSLSWLLLFLFLGIIIIRWSPLLYKILLLFLHSGGTNSINTKCNVEIHCKITCRYLRKKFTVNIFVSVSLYKRQQRSSYIRPEQVVYNMCTLDEHSRPMLSDSYLAASEHSSPCSESLQEFSSLN